MSLVIHIHTNMCTTDPWLDADSASVPICVLMPNGLIITSEVDEDTTLKELKEDVFECATREPLHGLLRQERTAYIFVCINEVTAEPEELTDENRKVFEVKPFFAFMRLTEKSGGEDEKTLTAQIGVLIGKGMHEFDAMKNSEVNDFRYRMSLVGEEIFRERGSMDWKHQMKYLYPERLNRRRPLPSFIQKKISHSSLMIEISSIKGKLCQRFTLSITQTVQEAISYALGVMDVRNKQNPDEFLLKVVGQEEFLTGDNILLDYSYVQECLGSNIVPSFIIIPVSAWIEKNMSGVSKSQRQRSVQTLPRRGSALILAETVTRKFAVTIKNVTSLNVTDGAVITMKVGIVHGVEPLSPILTTDDREYRSDEVVFNQPLVFDIIIKNLPQVSRMCFALFERKNNKEIPLSWVNMTVFDYSHRLRRCSVSVPMWTHASDLELENDLNVLGSNYPIPATDDAPFLTITFGKVTDSENPVCFASHAAADMASFDEEGSMAGKTTSTTGSKHHLSQLKQICDKISVSEIMEQDKELFRLLRADCCSSLPHALPHVLSSVRWHDRTDVSIMRHYLRKWPIIEAEHALVLLGPRFPSLETRRFAIKCLSRLTDDYFKLYLLQLVQSLRNEVFLFSDLSQFLLQKALSNQMIGHQFFWLLRSEMQDPAVTVCFGLLLEAYCRGAPDHIPVMMRQVESLKKLNNITDFMRLESVKKKDSRNKQKESLHHILSQSYYKDSLRYFRNTLNPRINLGVLKIEKCKVMDSKMKPLWLVFSHNDIGAEDVIIMYKNGDDLRQDMLTLQVLKVMDKIWKEEGLDLRMNPYGCVATDFRVGLIEVVKNAQTIANVQKKEQKAPSLAAKAASAFKKGSLLSWLKEHNEEEDSLSAAIEEFTLSCAGYCVASYVLGIADRHSDNIMIKKNGQLFHIDFGHIMGKFKEKFGIRRERVPFVLTHDFVYVITHGNEKPAQLTVFQNCCEQAFMSLRRKGHLIISLFSLMLASGIPEISSGEDLQYLSDTLVLQMTEEEALRHFRLKFEEALNKGWKTSLNWAAHNLAKDNP